MSHPGAAFGLPPERGYTGGPKLRVDTGTSQAAAIDRRLDDAVARAEATGEHVWIATVVHLIDPAAVMRGEVLHLDLESIASTPGYGCYRCEEPLSKRLLTRRCAGTIPAMPPGSPW